MSRRCITREVATVYRFGKRRYLTLRAARMAAARAILRGSDHHHVTGEDSRIGIRCECALCNDDDGSALQAAYNSLVEEADA
jgi:hypothetical protein